MSDEDGDALYLRGVEERNHHSVVLRKSGDIAALAVHLMTNTAVTGATFDIDGGQQLVER